MTAGGVCYLKSATIHKNIRRTFLRKVPGTKKEMFHFLIDVRERGKFCARKICSKSKFFQQR